MEAEAPQRHLTLKHPRHRLNNYEAHAPRDLRPAARHRLGHSTRGRYHDTLHEDDGTWCFHCRASHFVTWHSG